jgi:transposase
LIRGSLFTICQQYSAVISSISHLFSVTVSEDCDTSWYCILQSNVLFPYDSYVKYGYAGKCRRKFRTKLCDEGVPSRQTIHNLVNKLTRTGLLIDKKHKHKRRVLTKEKLDDIGARIEHIPRKSQKCLNQETGVSKSSARTATQLLKFRPYKTTVINARLAAARSSWQGSFLQLVCTVCCRR